MTSEAAQKRASDIVRALEVPYWEEYKHWEGRFLFKNDRYEQDGTWAFVWHRFIDGQAIWDEYLQFQFDDADGQLVFVNNRTSSRTYAAAKRPKLTVDRAKEIVLKEWPVRVKRAEKSVATVAIDIKSTDLHYQHLDVRYDDYANLVNPGAERRLRLLYRIGLIYSTSGGPAAGYTASEWLLVDAETGEMWRDTPDR